MAMKKNLTLRIDPELKMQASELFNALGMDLSTATGIFFRQALRCHGLPFEVKLDDPNEISIKAIEDAINDRNMSGPFDSVSDLMEVLDAYRKHICGQQKYECKRVAVSVQKHLHKDFKGKSSLLQQRLPNRLLR